jgi:hypothetical protein
MAQAQHLNARSWLESAWLSSYESIYREIVSYKTQAPTAPAIAGVWKTVRQPDIRQPPHPTDEEAAV